MNSVVNDLQQNWQIAFNDKKFKRNFITTIIFLFLSLIIVTQFLDYNETRQGFRIDDPLLSLFNPIDVTWITFIIIYGGVFTALGALAVHPKEFKIILQSYSILILFRIFLMYMLPLDPPSLIIPLKDPFVEFFGSGKVLEKDLFFSGHTSTMFLLFLASKNVKLKTIFLIGTFIVGAAVLVQHVHYTVDVLVAPFIAFTSFKIIEAFNR